MTDKSKQNQYGESDSLTPGESREILKHNRKLSAKYERLRHRRNIPSEEYLSSMKNSANVAEIENLKTYFFTESGTVKAADGVTFSIPRGKTVGVVGESGCGKSVVGLSLMRLIQHQRGQIVDGSIRFDTGDIVYDIAKLPENLMKNLRGSRVSMIFQEPMTCLNPVIRIGSQLGEVFALDNIGKSRREIKELSTEALRGVGIANAEGVYKMYPHELSGGMRQRVMIAMALSRGPRLVVADEPTTALDVTVQAQILDLLRTLREKANTGVMLITHDLGVVAEMADTVVVMYAGRVVERGAVSDIFNDARHPYTVGLMKSKPALVKNGEKLYNIPGKVPDPVNLPDHCYFYDRCDRRTDKCKDVYPAETRTADEHYVSCYHAESENTEKED